MKSQHKILSVLILAATVVVTADAHAQRGGSNELVVQQGRKQEYSKRAPDRSSVRPRPPRLGFNGTYVRDGIRVDYVRSRSLAWFAGLERGDVIASVNRIPLSYSGCWSKVLSRALQDDGRLSLEIIDVRDPHARSVFSTVDITPQRAEY